MSSTHFYITYERLFKLFTEFINAVNHSGVIGHNLSPVTIYSLLFIHNFTFHLNIFLCLVAVCQLELKVVIDYQKIFRETLQLHCNLQVPLLSQVIVCLSVTRVYCDKTAEVRIM